MRRVIPYCADGRRVPMMMKAPPTTLNLTTFRLPTTRPAMFSLQKWYLDVVTRRGDVVILYAARLRWGALRVGYGSALEDRVDGTHRDVSTRRVDAPTRTEGGVGWQNGALEVAGRWCLDVPPFGRTLASTPGGVIRWTCHVPRARASVRVGDVTYHGLGYIEHLRLTIPPWQLPFDALRWGRHISDRHSLVWIDWRGPQRQSWVWLDGGEQHEAIVTDGGVSGLADGAELCLQGGRDVVKRDVLAAFTGLLPGLARRLAGRLTGLHEHKRIEPSAIVRAGERQDAGWTLREVVTW